FSVRPTRRESHMPNCGGHVRRTALERAIIVPDVRSGGIVDELVLYGGVAVQGQPNVQTAPADPQDPRRSLLVSSGCFQRLENEQTFGLRHGGADWNANDHGVVAVLRPGVCELDRGGHLGTFAL